jgi:hypothetical protein
VLATLDRPLAQLGLPRVQVHVLRGDSLSSTMPAGELVRNVNGVQTACGANPPAARPCSPTLDGGGHV